MLKRISALLLQVLCLLDSVMAAAPGGHDATAVVQESGAACTLDRSTGTVIDPEPFLAGAYGLRWHAASNRLAYMEPGADGFYRVMTMDGTGRDRRVLAQGLPEVPAGHQGTPYWQPSGEFLIFTAEKAGWHGARLFGIPDYEALPGFGRHDDLWVARSDGSRAWQLTHDEDTKDQGILIPVISPDGKHIAWAARQPGGSYLLVMADFVPAPEPHLTNLRRFRPGGGHYFEPGAFTSDGRQLAYTSDQDTHSFWRSQIYLLDIATGDSTRMTQGNDYNEHPTVVATPTGDWLVYMSTRGVDRYPLRVALGTDWYAVRADGTGFKRLTRMNVNRKDNPQNAGHMQVAGTVAVSPAGDYMLGDVQDSLVKQTGLVRTVHFVCR